MSPAWDILSLYESVLTMPLTRNSVLHHWSSRNNVIPIIGGKPVHARNSSAMVGDVRGEQYDVTLNTPRFSWEMDKSSPANELRAGLLLEGAFTNPLLYSNDFTNGVWVKDRIVITAGVLDPKGGTSAATATFTGAAGVAEFRQTLAVGSSVQRVASIWVRRRTGTGIVYLINADGVSTTDITNVIGTQWQRFTSTVRPAATGRICGLQLGTVGDAVDVYNGQIDDTPFPSSDIVTGSAVVTRSVDSFYWNFPHQPQAMMIYGRFVDKGLAQTGSARVFEICGPGDAIPYVVAIGGGPASGIQGIYNNGVTNTSSTPAGPAANPGDTVEFVLPLAATGAITAAAGTVGMIQSINGGGVNGGGVGATAAFPANWSGQRLWLGSVAGSYPGGTSFLDLRIVKYADVAAATAAGIMAELRAFELGPNGDVL
jgi:hypothetical protein